MELLKKYIIEKGSIVSDEILKVDTFLNHQIDPKLIFEIGKEFKKIFNNEKIDKILTIEASGIAIGVMTGYVLNVPVLFAKKKKPTTLSKNYCVKKVFSFTKNDFYDIILSKEFINKNENILIVDDFLANGNAALALAEIVEECGANVVGIGIVIEKSFQNGRDKIIEKGYRLESLAKIKEIKNNKIIFNN